ncbi:MAG: hypothetical protein RR520_03970 [Erysipelotrichaceae bacterium]
MKKTSKLVKIFFVLLLSFTTLIGVKAQTTQTGSELTKDWTYFLGNYEMPGVSDAKTPTIGGIKPTKLFHDLKGGNPIIVDDYIYFSSDNYDRNAKAKINKLDKSGKIIASADINGKLGFFTQIAYGNGMIFVPFGDGEIQAFDANTLKSLWISKKIKGANQALSAIVYQDGYIYSGYSNATGSIGCFFGIDVRDEDTSKPDEMKDYKWTYGDKGYYWSSGVIANDKIYFAGTDGNLVSHSLKDNTVFDTLQLGSAVQSIPAYDKKRNQLFISAYDGTLKAVDLDSTGKFIKTSLKSVRLATKEMTSSPVVYHDSVYIAGGGVGCDGAFNVVSADNLTVKYKIDSIKSQSTPLVSSAYENGKHEVYIYVVGYADGIPYIIHDDGNAISSEILTDKGTNLHLNDSSSFIADYDGNLYLHDAYGTLYAFGNKNGGAYTSDDVIRKIKALPSIDNISETDYFDIHNLVKRYEKLSVADQGKVTNIDTLNQAYAQVLSLKDVVGKINKINKDIESLNAIITLQDENKITTIWNMYQGLNATDKTKVVNANKLIDLKAQLDKLLLDEKIKDINDKISKLDDIKDIPLNKKNDVMNLIQRVESLSKEDQKRITNKDKLYKTYQFILDSEKKIKDINDKIWNNIKPLNVTLDDESDIIEINKLYQSLRKQDQKLIDNYQDVINAQRIIDGLKNNQILPEVFDHIKGKDMNYEYKGSVNNKAYSITFNGLDIKDSLPFNPEIKFFSDKNNMKIKGLDANAFVISFSNHGKLPGKATIEIQTDLKDGIYHLFYYDETKGEAEFQQDIEVKNGIAKFVIDHTSDYFLSKKATKDINTGDMTNTNEILIVFVLSLIALTGISLYTVKKKRI